MAMLASRREVDEQESTPLGDEIPTLHNLLSTILFTLLLLCIFGKEALASDQAKRCITLLICLSVLFDTTKLITGLIFPLSDHQQQPSHLVFLHFELSCVPTLSTCLSILSTTTCISASFCCFCLLTEALASRRREHTKKGKGKVF
jgi:hypothetical protein